MALLQEVNLRRCYQFIQNLKGSYFLYAYVNSKTQPARLAFLSCVQIKIIMNETEKMQKSAYRIENLQAAGS